MVEIEIKLRWSSYASPDFRKYKVYQHSTSGLDETSGELIHVATDSEDTTFTISLPHSSQKFYRVLDEHGLLAGISNIVDAVTGLFEKDPVIKIGEETPYFLMRVKRPTSTQRKT